MKITIESTSRVVNLYDKNRQQIAPARIWEGVTEKGARVVAVIARVTTDEPDPVKLYEFEQDLIETKPPSAFAEAIPLRFIL